MREKKKVIFIRTGKELHSSLRALSVKFGVSIQELGLNIIEQAVSEGAGSAYKKARQVKRATA